DGGGGRAAGGAGAARGGGRAGGRCRALGPPVGKVPGGRARWGPPPAADFDHHLLDDLIAVESACCPFFTFSFDQRLQRLEVGLDSSEAPAALDAIADAFRGDQAARSRRPDWKERSSTGPSGGASGKRPPDPPATVNRSTAYRHGEVRRARRGPAARNPPTSGSHKRCLARVAHASPRLGPAGPPPQTSLPAPGRASGATAEWLDQTRGAVA